MRKRAMPKALETALTRMGYRLLGAGRWCKPVAYHLLVVHMSSKGVAEWCNYFVGVDGKTHRYSSAIVDKSDYLSGLKFLEHGTRFDICPSGGRVDFSFLTCTQRWEAVL